MNILLAVYLRVVAVYLAISVFNTINFMRAVRIARGQKVRLNPRAWRVAIKFGFGWHRPLFFWLLDWYLGLTNFDRMVKLVCGK